MNWRDLDKTQKLAYDAVQAGSSLAILGGSGCGKTHLLRLIQEDLSFENSFPRVVTSALTSRGAAAINGISIHKLFGLRHSVTFSSESLWDHVSQKPVLCATLKKIGVLVIDEASLIANFQIDAIDFVLRRLSSSERCASLPLGGRQLIVAADPFQLEPYALPESSPSDTALESLSTFFLSETWNNCFGAKAGGMIAILNEGHRQSDDPTFFSLLNRIRIGRLLDDDISILNGTSAGSSVPPESHTRLVETNDEADNINSKRLSLGVEPLTEIFSRDELFVKPSIEVAVMIQTAAPKIISLRENARVLFTRKLTGSPDIPPGTCGTVTSIRSYPAPVTGRSGITLGDMDHLLSAECFEVHVRLDADGRVVRVKAREFEVFDFQMKLIAKRVQVPLIPAYALGFHRAQGLSLSLVAIDFSSSNYWRQVGMVYVALSRCKSLSGLWVRKLRKEQIVVSWRSKVFMLNLMRMEGKLEKRFLGIPFPDDFGLRSSLTTQEREAMRAQYFYSIPMQEEPNCPSEGDLLPQPKCTPLQSTVRSVAVLSSSSPRNMETPQTVQSLPSDMLASNSGVRGLRCSDCSKALKLKRIAADVPDSRDVFCVEGTPLHSVVKVDGKRTGSSRRTSSRSPSPKRKKMTVDVARRLNLDDSSSKGSGSPGIHD